MTDIKDDEWIAQMATLWQTRSKGLIHGLNLQVERANREGVRMRMPFNPNFCADEAETLLHGGVLTSLLDSAFGLSIFLAVGEIQTMATLDLRVDYLRPAKTRSDVIVEAQCHHQTRHIAFGTGQVMFDGAENEVVAHGTATFALTRGDQGAGHWSLRPKDGNEK
ncbi:MAG: PaaI family thioesterase [Marinosulfonomonas sp.]|nr:PaaI family thioesterase [Marinosulfonomonas sp.]